MNAGCQTNSVSHRTLFCFVIKNNATSFFNLKTCFMRHIFLKPALATVVAFALFCLNAFTVKRGVDVFEIYLNNKLIVRQAMNQPIKLQSLQLNKTNINDNLVVYYNHCGATGKNRTISIRDDNGNVVKEWKFADASGSNTGMTIPVKELLQLEKRYANTHINLFYTAEQLPKGRMLSAVQFNEKSTTWLPGQDSWTTWAAGFASVVPV
jgi:hypothetical protein